MKAMIAIMSIGLATSALAHDHHDRHEHRRDGQTIYIVPATPYYAPPAPSYYVQPPQYYAPPPPKYYVQPPSYYTPRPYYDHKR